MIKAGNVSVRFYPRTRKRSGERYQQFDVTDHTSGKRKFISSADSGRSEGTREGQRHCIKLANLEGDSLKLTGADRCGYLRALELLKPPDVSIVNLPMSTI